MVHCDGGRSMSGKEWYDKLFLMLTNPFITHAQWRWHPCFKVSHSIFHWPLPLLCTRNDRSRKEQMSTFDIVTELSSKKYLSKWNTYTQQVRAQNPWQVMVTTAVEQLQLMRSMSRQRGRMSSGVRGWTGMDQVTYSIEQPTTMTNIFNKSNGSNKTHTPFILTNQSIRLEYWVQQTERSVHKGWPCQMDTNQGRIHPQTSGSIWKTKNSSQKVIWNCVTDGAELAEQGDHDDSANLRVSRSLTSGTHSFSLQHCLDKVSFLKGRNTRATV